MVSKGPFSSAYRSALTLSRVIGKLDTATVSKDGRHVNIPKVVRNLYDINGGDKLEFYTCDADIPGRVRDVIAIRVVRKKGEP